MKNMCRFRILGFFLLIPWGMQAQEPNSVNITIISEAAEISSDPQDFEKVIREEIEVLLRNRFEVAIKSLYANLDPDKIQANIDQAFQDPQTDIIISIGSVSSAILARQEDYPKPCIASIILDQKLQGIPGNQQGGSGVKNFTFLESPFDIKRDLETLYRVQAFDRVGLLAPAYIRNLLPFPMDEYFAQQLSPLGLSFDFIPYEENGGGALAEIPEDVEAIYILPSTADISDQAERNLISQINERGLLSAGLLGDDWLDKGSLLGYNSTKNLQLIPRRIALNVLKIAEGQSAADLPVKVPTYTETLLINMATARQIEKFPDFDLMAQAILLNLNEVETDRSLSLEGVLAEALRANLEVLIAEKDVDLADKDLSISKTDLLPQVVGSSTINLIDPNSSQNSFGSQGRVNWSAAANLSQVILSEPTLANIAIQRYLLEGQKYALQEQQLEIIQRTSETYLSVLQAQTNLRVRQDNVLVTKENYDIAQAKEAVGYSGATDINRFKAELAQNNIALNNAQAQYKQSQYALNQLLNRPVDEEFVITEDNFQTPMERVIDPRILNLINNYGDLRKYGDFLVDESKRRLPEIKQLEANISATERQRKSQMRSFYIPSLDLTGSTNYVIQRFNAPANPFSDVAPVNDFTWSFGLNLQYPLFLGDSRRRQVQRTKVALLQLQDQKNLLYQQLELAVRSALETASASFSRVSLSQEAAEAAAKNFDIIQDNYSQGLINITSLIDAQNTALQTSLEAENANYQFMIDILNLERRVGFYFFLADPEDRDLFFDRLTQFLSSQE